jgi:Protein of unknown function (DUF2971)
MACRSRGKICACRCLKLPGGFSLARALRLRWDEMKPSAGTSLFHYTTAAGLIGIVNDQTLFATHANFLNDAAELQILADLLAPQLSREFREIIPKLQAVGAFKPKLFTTFGESIYDSEASNLCRTVMRIIDRVSPIYVTSFCMHAPGSEEYEHGLLSQWRGYGRGGFAIEFDEAALDKLTVLEIEKRSFQMIATREVTYTNHEKDADLKRFEGLGTASLAVGFREKTPKLAAREDVAALLGTRDFSSFIPAFIQTVPFLKTPRFREENEYRLVALATRPSKVEEDTRTAVAVRFREGGSGTLIPYVRLFETLELPLPIKKIIVGPHRDQDNQYKAAQLLLEQKKIEVPVVLSDTTLKF